MKTDLEERTLRFALDTLAVIDQLPGGVANNVVAYQLGKAATAVGGIYREARRAETKKDFIHKIGMVSKEASESEYWLIILSKRLGWQTLNRLRTESSALARIFIASGRTASRSTPPRKR